MVYYRRGPSVAKGGHNLSLSLSLSITISGETDRASLVTSK